MSKNSQIIDVTVISALFYHSFFKFCDKGDIATFLTYTIDSKMPYYCLGPGINKAQNICDLQKKYAIDT